MGNVLCVCMCAKRENVYTELGGIIVYSVYVLILFLKTAIFVLQSLVVCYTFSVEAAPHVYVIFFCM